MRGKISFPNFHKNNFRVPRVLLPVREIGSDQHPGGAHGHHAFAGDEPHLGGAQGLHEAEGGQDELPGLPRRHAHAQVRSVVFHMSKSIFMSTWVGKGGKGGGIPPPRTSKKVFPPRPTIYLLLFPPPTCWPGWRRPKKIGGTTLKKFATPRFKSVSQSIMKR